MGKNFFAFLDELDHFKRRDEFYRLKPFLVRVYFPQTKRKMLFGGDHILRSGGNKKKLYIFHFLIRLKKM